MDLRIEDCDDAAFATIVPLLRATDIEEWRLFAGATPAHLIRDGFRLPAGADTLTRIAYGADSGRPLVVYGVSPLNNTHTSPGWVWLVATDEAQEHGTSIHRKLLPEFRDKIVPMFPKLMTASWADNHVHHVWLRKLGFKQARVPWAMGPHQAEFLPFTYTRKT